MGGRGSKSHSYKRTTSTSEGNQGHDYVAKYTTPEEVKNALSNHVMMIEVEITESNKEFYSMLAETLEHYSQVTGKQYAFVSLKETGDVANVHFLAAYHQGDLLVHQDYSHNMGKLAHQLKSDFDKGFSSTDTIQGLIMHEMGHKVEQDLSRNFPTSYSAFYRSTANLDAPSTYGSSSRAEAFAEAYALITSDITPTRGAEYVASVKTFLQNNGVKIPTYSTSQGKANRFTGNAKDYVQTKTPILQVGDSKRFSRQGKTVSVAITKTALDRGYAVKTIKGTKYHIDVYTGEVSEVS